MRNSVKHLVAILLCMPVMAWGQEKTEKVKLTGKADVFSMSYLNRVDGKVNANNECSLQLNIQSDKSKDFGYYSSLKIREDFSDETRKDIYAKELYVFFKKSKFDLKAGKQIIEWGMTDRIKPTDNICHVDYYDFLESEKLGVYAVNINAYTGIGKIQGIFIPVFSETKMPNAQSRWYLNQTDILPSSANGYPITYSVDQKTLDKDLSSSQFAVQYSNSFGSFDVDLNYYNGYPHIPETVTLKKTLVSDTLRVDLQKQFYRHQVIGGSLARVFGNYSTRMDVAYFMPDGVQNTHQYARYSIGIDRTFYDLFGNNNLFILIQWMDELKKKHVEFSKYDINHLFTRSLMAKMEWSHGLTFKLGIQGIYRFDVDNYYIQPFVNYNIFDGLNAYCQVDMLGGESEGFYSYYGFNRIRVGISYDF